MHVRQGNEDCICWAQTICVLEQKRNGLKWKSKRHPLLTPGDDFPTVHLRQLVVVSSSPSWGGLSQAARALRAGADYLHLDVASWHPWRINWSRYLPAGPGAGWMIFTIQGKAGKKKTQDASPKVNNNVKFVTLSGGGMWFLNGFNKPECSFAELWSVHGSLLVLVLGYF